MKIAIHTNPGLHNQRQYGSWLAEGFRKHGLTATVTGDKTQEADIHVIQGPHYAYHEWLGKPNVLWLNRCYYGHDFNDVSLGWLRADGTRDFMPKDEPHGVLPELQPMKDTDGDWEGYPLGCVVFADYGGLREADHWAVDARHAGLSVYVRAHPADTGRYFYSLDEMWARCAYAVGGQSTVLVDAVINGLHTTAHDPKHVVQGYEDDRAGWLARLSWANWNFNEIRNGDFWEHLGCGQDV